MSKIPSTEERAFTSRLANTLRANGTNVAAKTTAPGTKIRALRENMSGSPHW